MKKLFLLLFVIITCALQANAQKIISYKVYDGKAYYKVEESGKEPMYYRKKLASGNVALDFEKVSNGIFGYQYEEVKGEVKYLEGENIKEAIEQAAKEKELQELADKRVAEEEKARQKEAEEAEKAEKQLRRLQEEKASIENEIDVIGTNDMTTEEKLLYQLLQENKEQRKHLATLKWLTVTTTALSVGSAIGYIIATLIWK